MGGSVALSAPEYIHRSAIARGPLGSRLHVPTCTRGGPATSQLPNPNSIRQYYSVRPYIDATTPFHPVSKNRDLSQYLRITRTALPLSCSHSCHRPVVGPPRIQQRKGNGVISRCDSQSLVLPLSSLKSLSSRQMRLLASVRTIDSYIVFLSQLLPTTSITRSRHPSCAASW